MEHSTKINEVVSRSDSFSGHLTYKGLSLSQEKILYYRMTFQHLRRAPLDLIIEKHKQVIQEKLLVDGPNLEKRKKIASYYNF